MTWLTSNPTATAQQLAQQIVIDYGNFYGANSSTNQSAIDLSTIKTPSLATDLHTLASHLRSNIPGYLLGIQDAKNRVQRYDDDDYVDLYHFA